ncbi:MAG: multicopper oxidase family protein [Cohaesibacter sp.]|nr:multicopper oxidase family protein [Cohaesibacter sp.]
MKFNRRDFLKTGLGAAAISAMPGFLSISYAKDGFIEIRAMESEQKLYLGDVPASTLWTYNGSAPGPEIRVKQGERVKVRFINELKEPSSIHWHGIRIANAMDGVSGLTQDPVQPGETFEYDFVVPDAGTYWYHAHNKSWNQVGRGLYGPLIVEEVYPTFDEEHDLTLVIDDWRLNQSGQLDEASFGMPMDWSHGGRLGNWLTINGQSMPEFELNAGEAYRLRLINVSNARILELDPNRFDAKILAYDGQPVEKPEMLSYEPFLLGSAQRVDLLVVPKEGRNFSLEELSGQEPFPYANFKVVGSGKMTGQVPVLKPNSIPKPNLGKASHHKLRMTGGAMGQLDNIFYKGKRLEGRDFVETRQFWAFNGIANLPADPFFAAEHNETIIVEIINDTAFAHAMHVHGHHFQILEREGSIVEEGQPWKDTFLIGPEQAVKIAFVADNPGKWLIHCHMLEHAASGMTTWFTVA